MILRVFAKCSDSCAVSLTSDDGKLISEKDGYVPNFFPGKHFGDYIILNIDPETGMILNWPKELTQEKMWHDLKIE